MQNFKQRTNTRLRSPLSRTRTHNSDTTYQTMITPTHCALFTFCRMTVIAICVLITIGLCSGVDAAPMIHEPCLPGDDDCLQFRMEEEQSGLRTPPRSRNLLTNSIYDLDPHNLWVPASLKTPPKKEQRVSRHDRGASSSSSSSSASSSPSPDSILHESPLKSYIKAEKTEKDILDMTELIMKSEALLQRQKKLYEARIKGLAVNVTREIRSEYEKFLRGSNFEWENLDRLRVEHKIIARQHSQDPSKLLVRVVSPKDIDIKYKREEDIEKDINAQPQLGELIITAAVPTPDLPFPLYFDTVEVFRIGNVRPWTRYEFEHYGTFKPVRRRESRNYNPAAYPDSKLTADPTKNWWRLPRVPEAEELLPANSDVTVDLNLIEELLEGMETGGMDQRRLQVIFRVYGSVGQPGSESSVTLRRLRLPRESEMKNLIVEKLKTWEKNKKITPEDSKAVLEYLLRTLREGSGSDWNANYKIHQL